MHVYMYMYTLLYSNLLCDLVILHVFARYSGLYINEYKAQSNSNQDPTFRHSNGGLLWLGGFGDFETAIFGYISIFVAVYGEKIITR
jgi:hypothetical protein